MLKNTQCLVDDHNYDTLLSTKQVTYEKDNKEYDIFVVQSIICSKCGNILYPDYPENFSGDDLEEMVNLSKAVVKKKVVKRKKR